MSTPLLRIVGLNKQFGDVQAVRGIDISVDSGSVVCLLGPSGSGKSTVLRCINRLETPTSGYVNIDGDFIGYEYRRGRPRLCSNRLLARQRRCTGMVFQQFHLFAHKTVLENVMEAQLSGLGVSKRVARAKADQLLERVGLADRASHYPAHISGGQQQRVAIARALATDPKVLLFDEPTSALDPELVGEVLEVMRGLADDGVTMLVVTHEIEFARDVATEVHFMDDGLVVETGSPEQVIDEPLHARTKEFLAHVATPHSDQPADRTDKKRNEASDWRTRA